MSEQDQQFVEYVLKNIVDNPDDVTVDRTIDEMGVLISVSVNPEDMGKVIGKSGQTAKAIRTLLKVVGAKNDARVNMKIIEPEGGHPPQETGTDAVEIAPERDEAEAIAEQQQTDAAIPQHDENDEIIDEATGDPVPDEPLSTQEQPDADDASPNEPLQEEDTSRRDRLDEKSPLDDL